MYILISENKGLSIIFTFLVAIALIFITFLIAKRAFREMKKEKEAKRSQIEGVLTKVDMDSTINTYINQVGQMGSFTLMYIDLDKFSDFVNAFTYKEAKIILGEIIKKIKKTLPSDIKLSRYQGDEFLVMFSQRYGRSDVIGFANDLLEQFRKPIKLYEETHLEQTASLALAFYPRHGNKLQDLLKSLKLTRYQLKKAGGNDVRIYSRDLVDEEETGNVDYYFQIKEAIEQRQFNLYYQPIMTLDGKKVFAYESLIRWNHPTMGVLSPAKFMPIMEQTGDIYWVGLWGLEKLLQTYQSLQDQGISDVMPTINLSSKQLIYDEIAVDFQKIVRRLKVDPKNVILEIEEFALYDRSSSIYNNLLKLKSIGFKVAIDGYGIDFDALEQIEKMDVDAIKFKYSILMEQKSYVAEKMLETLLEFINKKDKMLIVQDIETAEMVDSLSKYNAKYGQGFYYSKVLPEEKLIDFVKFVNKKG